MTQPGMDARTALARRKLLGILAGTWLAQAVYALARLGVPDLLRDGPRSATELAHACQADPRALGRLLRALAMAGLLEAPEPGVYGLNATTELLRTDIAGSVHLNAVMQGEEVFRSFAEIMHTVRTGRPAFEVVYGQSFYDYLGGHPEAARTFIESMGNQPPPVAADTINLGDARVVVDVGGGNGTLLVELMRRHPGLRGILVELPDAAAAAKEKVIEAGVDDRVECVAGSFFDRVPGGGDVYLLCRVLHNWDDRDAETILRTVHEAMRPGARLLVLEELLAESGTGSARAGAGMVDLLMLVTLEGCDRTGSQYRRLLRRAGFAVTAARPGADNIVEASRT